MYTHLYFPKKFSDFCSYHFLANVVASSHVTSDLEERPGHRSLAKHFQGVATGWIRGDCSEYYTE